MVNKFPGLKTNEDIHKSSGAKKEAGEGKMFWVERGRGDVDREGGNDGEERLMQEK